MRITGHALTIDDVYRVAVKGEVVEVDMDQLHKVKLAYDRVQKWGEERHPIYGVNTGFGELIQMIVPPKHKTQLQENLLRSHAAGGGEPFSEEVTRAIMVARLNCLAKGHSGVSPMALQMMQHFLNRRIHPVVPQQGSLGASGDLAPLSHLALPLIGDGFVRKDGQVRPSAEVLAEEALEPLELGFKEALALVNGTSAMTGTAALNLVKAFQLVKLELVAAADFVQCLRGSTRAFDPRGHELKNHAGQIAIASTLRDLLAESGLTREHSDIMNAIRAKVDNSDAVESATHLQNAYSVRCIPQVLGPVLDTLKFCQGIVENELNSCNDNPLIFDSPENVFHGGNFHGQYVAMASDYINIAVTEIGVLAERQLNRLLDPYLNGELPAFLAKGDVGLFCGYEGGQYLATSLASENLDLAAPASIKSIPSNGQNQDIVSMGLIGARKSMRLIEHVSTMVSILVGACFQASHFVGKEKYSPSIQEMHQALERIVPFYDDSTPLSGHIATITKYLTSEDGWNYLNRRIQFA